MARVESGSVIRHIESLFEGASVAGLSDRQLIERFTAAGGEPAGEAAFAALVARHGPMVLGICRQLLADYQHAEDAFQAVFLVLAQKARTIRNPDLLGNWLYGVAIRTAGCARQRVARRRRREEGVAMKGPRSGSSADSCPPSGPMGPPADRSAIDREQAVAVHEEVAQLPRAFRSPVVLCYFEGLTLEEAARRLRCPVGTLHSRLARARKKLRVGLARRGIVLSTTAMVAALVPRSASASIPPLLGDTTTRAALAFATRRAATGALPASSAALAQEVLRTMLVHELRLGLTTVLALATLAAGAGWLTRSLAMKEQPTRDSAAPVAQAAPRPTEQPRPREKPAPATAAQISDRLREVVLLALRANDQKLGAVQLDIEDVLEDLTVTKREEEVFQPNKDTKVITVREP